MSSGSAVSSDMFGINQGYRFGGVPTVDTQNTSRSGAIIDEIGESTTEIVLVAYPSPSNNPMYQTYARRENGALEPIPTKDGTLGLYTKQALIQELPEDLKEPVDRFRDATSDTAAHMEEMPIPVDILTAGQEAIGQWFGEKMAEDPLFLQSMEDWGETMQELGGEMEDYGGAIERAFDTYDIDPLAP